jgi:beta-glucosidase/6-phospho-beta-glucosidase/beta-galactosidase
MDFVVATGVECSAPVIAGGLRRDQLLLTGHWDRYEEDLDVVAELGISHVRYGVPFHVVARDPDRLDWTWTDQAFGALRSRGIEPIADLLHFGLPDDITGMGDPRLPARFLAYVEAFAERFPWVRWYTPVNEPFISAFFSAKEGWWNELQRSDRAFVRALDNTAGCAIEAMSIIRERRSDAIFLQSDACETYTASEPAAERLAHFRNEQNFLAFDLTYGRPVGPVIRRWLRRAGMSAERLAWFEANGTGEGCIVGLDYYEGNERLMAADGAWSPGLRAGFAPLARQFHDRYDLPFMLSETNCATERAVGWLTEVWNDTVELVDEGLPVVGFCWYGLTDMIDWDSMLREANDNVDSVGLVDLDRRHRPVASVYRQLTANAARGIVEALPVDDEVAA